MTARQHRSDRSTRGLVVGAVAVGAAALVFSVVATAGASSPGDPPSDTQPSEVYTGPEPAQPPLGSQPSEVYTGPEPAQPPLDPQPPNLNPQPPTGLGVGPAVAPELDRGVPGLAPQDDLGAPGVNGQDEPPAGG